MSKQFKKTKILVTGGNGFLGQRVILALKKNGLSKTQIYSPSSKEFDLRNKEECREVIKGVDTVIHLAANVGGIGYNQKFPGSLFFDNAIMGLNLIEEARIAEVKKFVAIGTVCAYPKFTPVPFREEDLWLGYPEETNAPYGLAKKMLLVQAQAYRAQYGFNTIYLIPVNLYGPGDNFHPQSSHVIPALIRKFYEAKLKKKSQVSVWGTGNATREFLYVDDAAEAIVKATQNYDGGDPVNIGSSVEINISNLARMISDIIGFKGKIVFDSSKPDGQPRRKLDTSKAKEFFDFEASTTFNAGLKKTITWFIEHYE
ncbi:MAG: GDP-L-fucose synthase [Patescibacteria group bacterium]